MTILLIAVVSLVTGWVFTQRRRVVAEDARWKFFALRDELRQLAADDESLLDRQEFWTLDHAFTCYARDIERISLWVVAPLLLAKRYRRAVSAQTANLERCLGSPASQQMAALFNRSRTTLQKYLVRRHPLLVLVLVVSVVLFSAGRRSWSWFVAVMLTGAADPSERNARPAYSCHTPGYTGMHNTNPSGPLCFYQHGPSPDWCSACSATGCSGRTH
jgi:hypothetical protein